RTPIVHQARRQKACRPARPKRRCRGCRRLSCICTCEATSYLVDALPCPRDTLAGIGHHDASKWTACFTRIYTAPLYTSLWSVAGPACPRLLVLLEQASTAAAA